MNPQQQMVPQKSSKKTSDSQAHIKQKLKRKSSQIDFTQQEILAKSVSGLTIKDLQASNPESQTVSQASTVSTVVSSNPFMAEGLPKTLKNPFHQGSSSEKNESVQNQTKKDSPSSSSQELEIKFGNFRIQTLPPQHKQSFKPLNQFPVNEEQQALLTALYRVRSTGEKQNALNALNWYFSSYAGTNIKATALKKDLYFAHKAYKELQQQASEEIQCLQEENSALQEMMNDPYHHKAEEVIQRQQSEITRLSPKEVSFEEFKTRMMFLPSSRRILHEKLPEDIVQRINYMAYQSFYGNLMNLQEYLLRFIIS